MKGPTFARIPPHREECWGKGGLGDWRRDRSKRPDLLRIQIAQVGSVGVE